MEFIMQNGPMILATVIAFNLVMGGLHAGLDFIKDKTVATWDNKADGYVVMAMGFAQKVIDLFGGNIAHK